MASINVLRQRLYLLAVLPPKAGTGPWKQQRIALRLDDTPSNMRTARGRLAVLEKQLANGTFDWQEWGVIPDNKSGYSFQVAIRMLYRKKVELGRTSENTWNVNYMGRLRQIPPNQPVTTGNIERALAKYRREQCSYKELYYLLKQIADLTGCKFPEVPIPTYDKSLLIEVPTDAEIIDWVQSASEIHGWYFGMMAAYGLRPHEIEGAVMLDNDMLQVAEDTKTGYRTVVPLHADWVDVFDLRNRKLRATRDVRRTASRNDQVAQFLHREMKRLRVEWRPYALRHAYAGRLWRVGGSDLSLHNAAALMGHSVKRHVETYRAHIDPKLVAAQAQEELQRGMDRIKRQAQQALVPTQEPQH